MAEVGGSVPLKYKLAHCFHVLPSCTGSVVSINQCIRNDRSDCKEACLPTLVPLSWLTEEEIFLVLTLTAL